jgi:hypothetical protein
MFMIIENVGSRSCKSPNEGMNNVSGGSGRILGRRFQISRDRRF